MGKAEELLRELMRRNASLGGKARIAKLTPAQRTALARKAGKASGRARKARSARRSHFHGGSTRQV